MNKYTVVDPRGDVQMILGGDDESSIQASLPSGCTLLSGDPPSFTSRYVDGVWHERPEQPHSQYRWNPVDYEWYDPRTIAEVREQANERIKTARDQYEYGTFTWDGSVFDATQEAQLRIMGAAQMATMALNAGDSFSIDWTLADNTVRTLSASEMISVGQKLAAHITEAHAIKRQLQQEISSATTVAEVESVIWPS